MPKEKGDKMAITIWIDKSVVERIDALAEKGGITRSTLLANLIKVNVDELEIMNKMGLWALARVYEDMRQKLKKRYGKLAEMEKDKLKS